MVGYITDIQNYSIKDGPGIRTTVFMTGCNLRCKWCANPEAMYPGVKIFYDETKCQKCGCCVAKAKNNAITLGEKGCMINRELCTNLSDMVMECPFDAYEEKGRMLTVQELVKKILRDEAFYRSSGGGVTFSGGEAGLQKDFVIEVMKELKKKEIHIAFDTAGLWEYETMKPLIELTDIVLYDIKAFASDIHRRCTGVTNEIILENAVRLAKDKNPLYIRMILVPGWNDQEEDVRKRLEFARQLGEAVVQVDLLKYHNYGQGKYIRMGNPYPLNGVKPFSDEKAETYKQMAIGMGLQVSVGG